MRGLQRADVDQGPDEPGYRGVKPRVEAELLPGLDCLSRGAERGRETWPLPGQVLMKHEAEREHVHGRGQGRATST